MADSYTVHTAGDDLLLLTIPINDPSKYSTKPLKWIRYACGVVLGCKGRLVDYNDDEAELDLENAAPLTREFYFIPDGTIHFIDPDGLHHLTTSVTTTSSRAGFKNAILTRDSECVFTDFDPVACQAAHLIPHSKGSQYMHALCHWRNNDPVDEPFIEDIDDIRNGILVQATIHALLGQYRCAVISTPNFALNADEVLPARPEEEGPAANPFRFTPHYWLVQPSADSTIGSFHRDLRHPDIHNNWPTDWPPDFLWDFFYGVIISHHYGNEDTIHQLRYDSDQTFYPQGVQTTMDEMKKRLKDKKEKARKRKQEQNDGRNERADQRRNQGPGVSADIAMDTVFLHWMRSRYGPLGQKTAEDKKKEEEERNQEALNQLSDRVDEWRRVIE